MTGNVEWYFSISFAGYPNTIIVSHYSFEVLDTNCHHENCLTNEPFHALLRNGTYATQTKSWMVKWSWIIRAFSHWADVSFCRVLLLTRVNVSERYALWRKRAGILYNWREEDWILRPLIPYDVCKPTCMHIYHQDLVSHAPRSLPPKHISGVHKHYLWAFPLEALKSGEITQWRLTSAAYQSVSEAINCSPHNSDIDRVIISSEIHSGNFPHVIDLKKGIHIEDCTSLCKNWSQTSLYLHHIGESYAVDFQNKENYSSTLQKWWITSYL